MWKPTISSDELYHHGILGMQWGKRNGPPYPLGSGQHSAAEKKAGWQKSLKGGSTSKKKERTKSSEAVEKQGISAALVVIGVYALPVVALSALQLTISTVDAIKRRRETKEERKFRKQCDQDRKNAETDPKTGLKLKTDKDMSREEDSKRTNPDYKLDPNGARQNCVNCTTAYELRRRGFEVEAEKRSTGRNGVDIAKDIFNAKNNKPFMYPDPEKDRDAFINHCLKYENLARTGRNTECSKAAYKALKSEPKGSRGQLLITWSRWGGHSVAYEITKKGEVNIIDTQCNKIYSDAESKDFLARGIAVQYQRYDNKKLNVDALKKGDLVR